MFCVVSRMGTYSILYEPNFLQTYVQLLLDMEISYNNKLTNMSINLLCINCNRLYYCIKYKNLVGSRYWKSGATIVTWYRTTVKYHEEMAYGYQGPY